MKITHNEAFHWVNWVTMPLVMVFNERSQHLLLELSPSQKLFSFGQDGINFPSCDHLGCIFFSIKIYLHIISYSSVLTFFRLSLSRSLSTSLSLCRSSRSRLFSRRSRSRSRLCSFSFSFSAVSPSPRRSLRPLSLSLSLLFCLSSSSFLTLS